MPRTLLIATALVAAACSPSGDGRPANEAGALSADQASDTAGTTAALDSLAAQFAAAYNRDDAAAIAALHTDDVRFISEGTVEEGRAKLEEGWKKELPSLSGLKITTLDRVVGGDLATETIRFSQQYRNKGRTETDSGYAVSVLRRGPDGRWRYFTHALSRVPIRP